jgi:hypothetical protein
MGFDYERRYRAKHNQYPHNQASIPKESVNHEPLLRSPDWDRFYRQTIASFNNSQGRPKTPSTAFSLAPAAFTPVLSPQPLVGLRLIKGG